MKDIQSILKLIRDLHNNIRDSVIKTCEAANLDALSCIAREKEGDTIYAIDRISEEMLVDYFEKVVAPKYPLVLIAEGMSNGKIVLPYGSAETDAKWRIIMDPIDGTREIMYQKRSAWVLTGVARNHGSQTNLSDIELAIQTEIPLVKQHLSDTVWAIKGQGAKAERFNRITGEYNQLKLQPSRSATIAHGFAMISRFFPGARDILASIDEEIVKKALGRVQHGKAHCFEDQYLSTGGQFYELMAGHDRFIADLRPLMEPVLAARGESLGICCHPYDVCTELIARESGVIVTDENGEPLKARLDVDEDVTWVGYGNEHIRAQIEPLLQNALKKFINLR